MTNDILFVTILYECIVVVASSFFTTTFCNNDTLLYESVFFSTDEAATESILKSLELYASLCGKLDQTVSRDAFVTSLCRSALPAHYALTVLNIATPQSTSNAKGMSLNGTG